MFYSVVQTTGDRPSEETLRQTFRSLDWLLDIDASAMVRSGYGIVAERLSFDRANELGTALARHGVPNKVVAENQLPTLGVAQQTRRIDCLHERLVIYDPIGRTLTALWPDLRVVAAGIVNRNVVKKIKKEKIVRRPGGFSGVRHETRTDVRFKNEKIEVMQLELFVLIEGAPRRFQVRHDRCFFNYLGHRLCSKPEDNFLLLLQDLRDRAVSALLNEGFCQLVENHPDPAPYPNTRAFHEEIKWLLWRQLCA